MKMTQNLAIVLLFILLCAIAGVGVYSLTSNRPTPPVFACTMDALVCPDGSAVGRTGPNCSFAPCPTSGKVSGVFTSQNGSSTLTVSAVGGQAAGNIVPLDVSGISVPTGLSGKSVTLEGVYQSGNTFVVSAFIMPTTTATSSVPVASDSPVSGVALSIGESKVIGGVKLTLNRIVSDSRCPIDVQCIQAGNLVVNISLQGELDTETTDISSQSSHQFGNYLVSITKISPEKKSSVSTDPLSYRVSFSVTKSVQ